jgi:hypothetical protein
MMTFLSDNFRYSVFKNASNIEIAYAFTMGFLSYLIYSHDFSRISSNITLYTWIDDQCICEQLDRRHFPKRCDL